MFNVIAILRHSNYSKENLRNNIALLKISPPIDLDNERNQFVVPICLPPKKSLKVIGNCTTSGWNIASSNNENPNEFLKRADVEILKDSICMNKYKNYHSNLMICAGSPSSVGDPACKMNSGNF